MKKIRRALISVSDKTNLIPLAKALREFGIEIYSTGGTLQVLAQAEIPVHSLESYTGFPEMLSGRLKTLHPKIHAGILARRDNEEDRKALENYNILTFDLVVVNLYPFEEVISRDKFSFEEAIENIDIGGPAMIRAAAKNYQYVAVVVDPSQYERLIEELRANQGATSESFRFSLMTEAFSRTASYDIAIAQYLMAIEGSESFPRLHLSLSLKQALRYGENPHQKAGFYISTGREDLPWQQIHGKELSYNNILDLDIALKVGMEFRESVCAIFKHTNPCGLAAGGSQKENLQRAIACDPVSFFGGIVLINEVIHEETAAILAEHFLEIVVAPGFSEAAFNILSKKKNLRLIVVPEMSHLRSNPRELRSAAGGFLVQTSDSAFVESSQLQIVSNAKPDDRLLEEMLFAFQVVKYIKSNAVVFTRDKMTLGIGAGQMSRVDAVRFAIEKSKAQNLSLQGSVLASDAFFPFRDGVDLAIASGVRAIIQPGGSLRDEESIQAANQAGIVMAFTGIRHFRH
ncbi:MAG: bifunctional phosphoribosylaminoimidazolecarboxamide formyltransferase/IMP cyclohydrolase [Leptospiraceae bacterium]|nr:bifunctional phosphoribosylaminoimidazolecarboxamide formyltransferase/IMP cyclohydrolase [Leptospiraceae bacterium]MDW8306780.1 bifunctional phosphoribosylaminoimidazolecarboxamide formyltransferase/IMP cyclohydrolase [Leptospiraceae bacterium]